MDEHEVRAEEQRAIKLEESGDEAAALNIWMHLTHVRPTATFFCHAGNGLQSLGRFREAETAFRQAHQLDPTMILAPIGLATTLIKEKRFAEAVDVLKTVTQREENALAYELTGTALMNLGRSQEALQSFRKVVGLDSAYEEAFYNIGRLLRNVDDAGAQSAFSKALELDENYSDAHRELGWIYNKLNQLDLAERHLLKATEINPTDAWAWVYLGNLRWRRGQVLEAEQAFQQGRSHSPDEWSPNWALATLYEDRGDNEEAARFYHRALLASPDEGILLFHYGRFLFKQGDSDAAKTYLQRAIDLDPNYEKAKQLLAEMAEGPHRDDPR